MSELEIDREVILLVPFLLGAMVSVGLMPGQILPYVDLSWQLVQIPGTGGYVSLARLLSIVSLGAVVVNRDRSFREQMRGLTAVEMWIVYATIGMIVAPPLVPTIETILTHQPAALIAVLVQAAGFSLVSYLN